MNPTKTNVWVPVSSVKASASNGSRTSFYNDNSDALAEVIKSSGMDSLEPILVKPVKDGYKIITGESTLTAVMTVIKSGIPVENIKCNVFEDLSSVEETYLKFNEINGQKRHMLDSAHLITKLNTQGVKNIDISKHIGMNQILVSHYRKLEKLPNEVKSNIAKKVITTTQVNELLKETTEEGFNAKLTSFYEAHKQKIQSKEEKKTMKLSELAKAKEEKAKAREEKKTMKLSELAKAKEEKAKAREAKKVVAVKINKEDDGKRELHCTHEHRLLKKAIRSLESRNDNQYSEVLTTLKTADNVLNILETSKSTKDFVEHLQ